MRRLLQGPSHRDTRAITMSRMRRSLLHLVLAAAVLLVTSDAHAEDRERGPTVRLTLRYQDVTDGDPNPRITDFLYLENGLSVLTRHVFFDANTPMAIALVDGILTVIKFLAGGGDDFLLMDPLNPGELEPGPITIFEMSGGPQILNFGNEFFIGAGVFFEWSWFFPYWNGERLNVDPIDVGPMVHLWYENEAFELMLGIAAGNAFHRYGNWNPFLNISPRVDFRIYQRLWFHVSGRFQLRSLGFKQYEAEYDYQIPTETVAIRTSTVGWVLEAGPMFRF